MRGIAVAYRTSLDSAVCLSDLLVRPRAVIWTTVRLKLAGLRRGVNHTATMPAYGYVGEASPLGCERFSAQWNSPQGLRAAHRCRSLQAAVNAAKNFLIKTDRRACDSGAKKLAINTP